MAWAALAAGAGETRENPGRRYRESPSMNTKFTRYFPRSAWPMLPRFSSMVASPGRSPASQSAADRTRQRHAGSHPARRSIMASLIESLSQSLTPDLVGQISKTAGLDTSLVSKGFGVVGPLVTGALAKTAESPQALDGLMKLIPQGGTPSGISSLVSMITGGGASN